MAVTKAQWLTQFDGYWTNASSSNTYANYNNTYNYAATNGGEQEHYYLAWGFEGVLAAWRAGGNLDYLDDMIVILEEIITNSVVVNVDGTNYQGWPATKTGNVRADGQPLWESYLWRYVGTLLRVMKDSPILRGTNNGAMTGTTYQDNYDTLLAFMDLNIWDKIYISEVPTLEWVYRQNTHMASHWARIGMELHYIKGTQKYLDVFNNISFDGIPAGLVYENGALSDQLVNVGSGIKWYSTWNMLTVIQDTDHGGDITNFWVEALDIGYYWTQAHIDRLVYQFDNVIWNAGDSPPVWYAAVDGTGGTTTREDLHEWINLGRHSQALQTRLEGQYYPSVTVGHYAQGAGILALNQAYLEDSVVYPESVGATSPPLKGFQFGSNKGSILHLGSNKIIFD